MLTRLLLLVVLIVECSSFKVPTQEGVLECTAVFYLHDPLLGHRVEAVTEERPFVGLKSYLIVGNPDVQTGAPSFKNQLWRLCPNTLGSSYLWNEGQQAFVRAHNVTYTSTGPVVGDAPTELELTKRVSEASSLGFMKNHEKNEVAIGMYRESRRRAGQYELYFLSSPALSPTYDSRFVLSQRDFVSYVMQYAFGETDACTGPVDVLRCGVQHANQRCEPGQCCSADGYCGNTAAHCGADRQCAQKNGSKGDLPAIVSRRLRDCCRDRETPNRLHLVSSPCLE